MRKAILATVTVAAAAVAAITLVTAVVTDLRTPDGCQSVDRSLTTAITERATDGRLTVLAATAVENPFARGRSSVPFDSYYVIGIHFRTQDGTSRDGVWGLGTNAARHEPGQRLSVVGPIDGKSSALAAITSDARTWTDWPNNDIPMRETDPLVGKAARCLSN